MGAVVGCPTGTLPDVVAQRFAAYPHWDSIFGGSMDEDDIVEGALTAVPRWGNDMDGFLMALSTQRERPITILDLPGDVSSSTVYGAWLPTDDTDYIFVAEHLSGVHRQHVVLHELAHMVLNHRPSNDASPLFDGVSPELADRLLARHEHGDSQERQAELFASRLMAAADHSGEWADDPRGVRAAEVFG